MMSPELEVLGIGLYMGVWEVLKSVRFFFLSLVAFGGGKTFIMNTLRERERRHAEKERYIS